MAEDWQRWLDMPGRCTENIDDLLPPENDVVQFWLKEGDADLEGTVRDFLLYYFDYKSFYDVRVGRNGVSVFVILGLENLVSEFDGKIFELEEGLLYVAKVHESRMRDAELREDDMPNIEFKLV